MQYDCPKFKINKVIDIDSITSIHYFEFGDDFIDSPESHEPWELVYVDRGECNIIASDKTLLPFNTPDMHGLKIKSSGSLWGGPQSVLLRLELMLIEIVRDNHYYENKHKRFFPKEIIVDEFALKIISFMEERIYGRFTMAELSRELSFGKTYISKYFAKISGYSIINYFTMMKINEAKRLIRETKYNFFEISEMLMFSNSHYFSTTFKKYTGMTPSQYKKSCKKN